MGGATASLFKTLLVPAFISLSIFALLTYVLVPVWQKHRAKYSRYLPLQTISTGTSSLRERAQDLFTRWLLPSSWRSDFRTQNQFAVSAEDSDDADEGEELFEIDERRRAALSLDASSRPDAEGRRLSRDLEEGFRDDSEEDSPHSGTQNR